MNDKTSPITNPTDDQRALFERLDALNITHRTTLHAPVFTVDESQTLRGQIPGAHCKSLFLKSKAKQLYLTVVLEHRRVNLNALAKELGAKRFSFGNPDAMKQILRIEPGSVTPFALINDTERQLSVVLDRDLFDHDLVNFHPLKNDATTSIASADLVKFITACGHSPAFIDFAALTSQ